jgi:RimJ/RimL family protein N-acetyltransferase
LIFIKHNFGFLWKIIEWGNSILFRWLYAKRKKNALKEVFNELDDGGFLFRELEQKDVEDLYQLINRQEPSDLKYFHPHEFDFSSIKKQFKNHAFLMMGVFDNGKIIAYFFLRFFANRKCFVGRLIDKEYRGKGIGNRMNQVMYQTAWKMKFKCLSTISRNNKFVMKAHSRNSSMVVLKELNNNYLLVEFVNNPR